MLTTKERKLIYGDSLAVREGYDHDQYLGGHISMRLVIITRMKIKTMGITAFQSLLLTFRI